MYMYVSVFVRVYVTVSLFEDGTHGITLQSKCSATGIHTQTVNAFFLNLETQVPETAQAGLDIPP